MTVPPSLTRSAPFADRYRVEREIGRGASATVYLARDLKLGRPVAIKVIRPELAAGLSAERFLREISVTARLHHPHILGLHDSGEADGGPYYVMPYVAGESLRERLAREGRLPVADALRIAREVAGALHHAHERQLVHRDVKPENILLQDDHAVVADFGIVRALDQVERTGPRLTGDGFSPGTPAYMSPEQAAGDEAVDARSDQYGLACVLYEMLAGRPPFEGTSLRALLTRRIVERPDPVAMLRPDTPAPVCAALERALATAPGDRFATTADFARALDVHRASAVRALPRAARRGLPAAAGAAALAALAVGAWSIGGRATARAAGASSAADAAPDTALYAVLPFAGPGDAGARAALHLQDALEQWDDLRVVRALLVSDALARDSAASAPGAARVGGADGARRVARTMSAGRVVYGRVGRDGDSLRVDAAVYDAASGRVVQAAAAHVGPDLAGAADAFAALARRLLAAAPGVGAPPTAAAGGTRSLAAWRAYERGQLALRDWNPAAAAEAFAAATDADPDFARAQLWLAQAAAWRGGPSERDAAARAAALGERLSARDRTLAAALLALAEARQTQACAGFASLVARDSLDFAAWHGLGLCQWRDDAVLADARSPSGWRFRASHHAAARAFGRAMSLAPSLLRAPRGAAATDLANLLATEVGDLRGGTGPAPARGTFYAYPALQGDTVAHVPWPAQAFAEGRPETVPASYGRALAHNRREARAVLAGLARAFPRGADAQERFALALESAGELRAARAGDPSALDAFARALVLATEPAARARIASHLARVHLERGEIARARAIADSLLRAWPDSALRARPDREAILDRLAGLAALTGRARRAASLRAMASPADEFRTARGEVVAVPPELAADAARLRAHAAVGAPTDSIRAIGERLERAIETAVAPPGRAAAREVLLERPRALAVASAGLLPAADTEPSDDLLVRMQRAARAGDRAAFARLFADADRARATLPAGSVPLDASFHESWLLAAVGDTAAAVRRLDGALGALSSLGPWATVRVTEAAALPRAMALRAELAARAGDRATARRWAVPALTLWADADPELQPLVARLRALAR